MAAPQFSLNVELTAAWIDDYVLPNVEGLVLERINRFEKHE